MKKKITMNKASIFIALITTIIFSCILFICSQDQNTISVLQIREDSLRHECYKKDIMLEEATSTAIQLSDKLNRLYEIDPVAHKKVFSEAD